MAISVNSSITGLPSSAGANGFTTAVANTGGGGAAEGYTIPASIFLPTVASSPVVVYGMRRLVTAYSSALIQVQRASDNTNFDVLQLANGLPDTPSAVTFAAGSQLRIRTWYDQTGNGRHATQTVFANMPLFDAAGVRGQSAAFGAFKSALFDGWYDVGSGNIRRPKFMTIPTSAAFNFENHSIFAVINPKSALYNDIYWTINRSADGTSATSMGTAAGVAGVYAGGGPGNSTSSRRMRSQYQVLGSTCAGATSNKILQDGLIISTSVKWTDTLAGGIIGDGNPGFQDFLACGDNFLGFIIYPTVLADTQAASVRDTLNSAFNIIAPTGAQEVEVGDSLQYGPTVTESLEGRSITQLTGFQLKGNPALYNMGLSSQLLTGAGGLAVNASTREFALIDTSFAKRVLFIQIGGNDIATNGGTVGYGATLYTALTSYITSARTAGYTHIVVRTILPRTQGTQNNIELTDYNARLKANNAGADAISDVASHPVMGNPANILNTTYYQDALHPTGLGFELLAPIDAAAINSVL